jgi:glycosyltransferase involved in cell wall biosynthesis
VTPLVSIVTVCLNDAAGLARTLASVAAQTFADREVVVVDGGSTDGSVEVLRANASAGLVRDFVSEPDEGIYDAQNKGIRRARGTYLLFLNAGDSLASADALARLFADSPTEDVLYGDVLWEKAGGKRRRERTPDELSLAFFMRTNLPRQATAIRRAVFDRLGPYDTSLRIAADYEFFLRAIVVHGASTRHVPAPIAVQVEGGLSTRPESFAKLRAERRLARERALSPVLRAHWEDHVAAKDGPVVHLVRVAFRPAARRLRHISRTLRGRPDAED